MNAQSKLPDSSLHPQASGSIVFSCSCVACQGKLQSAFILNPNVSHITLLPIQSAQSAGVCTAPADRFDKLTQATIIERIKR